MPSSHNHRTASLDIIRGNISLYIIVLCIISFTTGGIVSVDHVVSVDHIVSVECC